MSEMETLELWGAWLSDKDDPGAIAREGMEHWWPEEITDQFPGMGDKASLGDS